MDDLTNRWKMIENERRKREKEGGSGDREKEKEGEDGAMRKNV